MRFIGSKDLLTDEIYNFLKNKNLMNKNLSFFDAFCGMGAISNSLKGKFNFIINDILNCCVIYTLARLNAEKCNFI